MTKQHKCVLALLALFSVPLLSAAQAIPAQVSTSPNFGFELPRVGGSLTYGISASELVSTGFFNGSGVIESTTASGDLAYVSKSATHPFSALYAGGVLVGNSGQPTTFYQNLSFSQVLSTKRWNIVVADSVSYLPQSPASGLSGIPGVGDLGIDPVTVGPTSGLGILTNYGPRVSNTLSGSVSRMLSAHTSAQASGNYAIQRFTGDNSSLGLDSTNEGGSAGLSYHFNARNTVTGNYNYSKFEYNGYNYSFTAQGATIDYSRQWNRRISTDVYAGPQVISGSGILFSGTSTQVAAGGSISYADRLTTYTLSYSRGVNNGSGVISGSFSDNVILAAHRQFGRQWAVSGSLAYTRFDSLPNVNYATYNGQSVAASLQAARALGRRFSTFANYTIEHQATSGSLRVANAFSGEYQIFGVGITYSPGALLLGR